MSDKHKHKGESDAMLDKGGEHPKEESKVESNDPSKSERTNQELYDLDRSAVSDELAEREKAKTSPDSNNNTPDGRKPNDIKVSDNETLPSELAYSEYEQVLRMMPQPDRFVIGMNEYLMVPPRRLQELPKATADEIVRLHGMNKYTILGEECIPIPMRTINTPQPLNHVEGLSAKRTHSDLWKENVEIDTERRQKLFNNPPRT